MIMKNDNDFSQRSNLHLDMAVMSTIGDRKSQQDCFGHKVSDDDLLLCICDGMGGYMGGSEASRLAVNTILNEYKAQGNTVGLSNILTDFAVKADTAVNQMHIKNAEMANAGTTLIMVHIKENMLFWSSVGDSRLYILRQQEFIQITKDQNYNTVLKEKVSAGEMSKEEYHQNSKRGDALVNYLGIGNLELIDYNAEPLKLKSGDRLVLCTDGLYRVLTNEEITALLKQCNDVKTALQLIEFAVRKKSKETLKKRDNMTAAVIKIK